MSRKSETLRALLEAVNRRDFDGAVEYLHPEVQIYPAMGGVMDVERRYHGRDGGRHLLEKISDGFENKRRDRGQGRGGGGQSAPG